MTVNLKSEQQPQIWKCNHKSDVRYNLFMNVFIENATCYLVCGNKSLWMDQQQTFSCGWQQTENAKNPRTVLLDFLILYLLCTCIHISERTDSWKYQLMPCPSAEENVGLITVPVITDTNAHSPKHSNFSAVNLPEHKILGWRWESVVKMPISCPSSYFQCPKSFSSLFSRKRKNKFLLLER